MLGAAVQDWEEALTLHVEDSLTLLPILRQLGSDASPVSVLDVGSGAGFPGVAVAIVEPLWQVWLAQ